MGVLSSVNNETQAIIQAASWTIESTGLAVGITIASTVFQKLSLGRLRTLLANDPTLFNAVSGGFGSLKTLEALQKQAITVIYLRAVRAVVFLTLAEILVAAIMSFLMKNNELIDGPKETEASRGVQMLEKRPQVAERKSTEQKPSRTTS